MSKQEFDRPAAGFDSSSACDIEIWMTIGGVLLIVCNTHTVSTPPSMPPWPGFPRLAPFNASPAERQRYEKEEQNREKKLQEYEEAGKRVKEAEKKREGPNWHLPTKACVEAAEKILDKLNQNLRGFKIKKVGD